MGQALLMPPRARRSCKDARVIPSSGFGQDFGQISRSFLARWHPKPGRAPLAPTG